MKIIKSQTDFGGNYEVSKQSDRLANVERASSRLKEFIKENNIPEFSDHMLFYTNEFDNSQISIIMSDLDDILLDPDISGEYCRIFCEAIISSRKVNTTKGVR